LTFITVIDVRALLLRLEDSARVEPLGLDSKDIGEGLAVRIGVLVDGMIATYSVEFSLNRPPRVTPF
jgi:hypothetical protein